MRIGSLFSGAGGLDMAVAQVFGGEIVWHAEIDKAASKVLAHRFPGVPNLGSVTDIDWGAVPPVDVICGGFPCTDVSAAGKRAGMHGTRSGLWSHMAEAIDVLRPRYVVIENVRGLLNADANRPMESDEDAVGNGSDRPVLRAIGAVLGDLADIGTYEARWVTLAASDVRAPHRRERVFILATAADSSRGAGRNAEQQHLCAGGRRPGESRVCTCGRPVSCGATPDSRGDGCGGCAECHLEPPAELAAPQRDDADRRVLADGRDIGCAGIAHTTRNRRHEGRPESAGIVGGSDAAVSGDEPGVALLLTPRSSDCFGAGLHGDGGMDLRTTISLLPTPRSHRRGDCESERNRNDPDLEATTHHFPQGQWGKYEPAIRRWERVLGRPAPAPTEPNKNGNPRLAAEFSSWLMGWPAGWVTDPAIGISRNDQLRIIGNGVVSRCAEAALRYLLAVAND